MKAIFDSNIYELADCQLNSFEEELKHFKYLSDIIDFTKDNNFKVVFSSNEYYAIVNMKTHPWNQYGSLSECSALIATFYDLMGLSELKENTETSVSLISSLKYCSVNSCACFNEFVNHIAFLKNSNQYFVFMGTANFDLATPLKFELDGKEFDVEPIMNINDDKVVNFSNGYRNLLLYDKDVKPTLENPLPNSDLCKQYKDWQKCEIERGQDYKIIYRKAVYEVALRNNYHFDECLTNLNSNSGVIRDIYTSNSKPIIHISADVRHGRIEVFNSSGEHQGEYSYIGEQKKPPDTKGSHNIRVK